jgi:hypothetical protein
MSKWEKWHSSLPEHTKEYLKKQPIWHDSDLAISLCIGFAIGTAVGCFLR